MQNKIKIRSIKILIPASDNTFIVGRDFRGIKIVRIENSLLGPTVHLADNRKMQFVNVPYSIEFTEHE